MDKGKQVKDGASDPETKTHIDRKRGKSPQIQTGLQEQATLSDTEKRLLAILETAVECIITISDNGCIESINPAGVRMFGYQENELIGQKINILMPSPYHKEHDGYIEAYKRTRQRKIIGIGREVLGKRKDGEVFPIDLAVNEIQLADRTLFAGFIRDITERKSMEAEIRKAEANLSKSQKLAKLGSFEFRMSPQMETYWSEEMSRLMGVREGSPIPDIHSWIRLNIHPDDQLQVTEVVLASPPDSTEFEVQFRLHPQVRSDATYVVSKGERVFDAKGNLEGIIGYLADVTERVELENEIVKISEAEQRRIGQDLHDGVCQHLAGIEFMSQVLEQRISKRSKEGAQSAAEIARLVREAIKQTRDVARGLSPISLDAGGLMSALEELAENTEHRFGVECHFKCPQPVYLSTANHSTHLYRITQEAVSNAVRHGKAETIRIGLSQTHSKVCLQICDDGVGFNPQKAMELPGLGIKIMHYRAQMMGARLTHETSELGGICVKCIVPIQASP